MGIFYIVFPLVKLCFAGNAARLFMGGFGYGYIMYDLTHYYIHHVMPNLKYYRNLKAHHTKHHYKDNERGFGISNKFWDFVFKTGFDWLSKLNFNKTVIYCITKLHTYFK